jgi:hypothetical protein
MLMLVIYVGRSSICILIKDDDEGFVDDIERVPEYLTRKDILATWIGETC